MFKRGILLSPRRRYQVPYGNTLYMPLREMSIGTSPNMINWDGDNPSSGFSAVRSILSNVDTPTPPVSPKCMKVQANDSDGTGQSVAQYSVPDHTRYLGITMTAKCYGYAPSTNTLTSDMRLLPNPSGGISAVIDKDDSWHALTVSKKPIIGDASVQLFMRAKTDSTADTDDVAYFDDVSLTVPQSITPNGLICHPEGCIWTPSGFYFDGVDDLITFESDFIGTSACTIMGWIKPTGWGANNHARILENMKLYFHISSNAGGASNAMMFSSDYSTIAVSANNSITLNQWNHVAVTRASDGKANFYVNGQLSGTPDQSSGTPTAGTTNIVVGNRLAGDRGFAGTIDDLSVYNRILTLQEIQAHYSMTKWSY
jgi:hypothetical protein